MNSIVARKIARGMQMRNAKRKMTKEDSNSAFCILHSAFVSILKEASRMRLSLLALLLAAAALAQPNLDTLAKHVMDVQAPGWEKTRYFSFAFDVERDGKRVVSFPQQWDRYTGDYRVSGKDQQGRAFVIVMNTNTKKGKAWINGALAEGKDLDDMLTLGYKRFINDTYWLLMGLKMLDPGVHRAYEGEKTDNGHHYDVVKLWFDQGVGLTPADQYWAYINRDTGFVDQWHMKLQGTKPEDPESVVLFKDFKNYEGMNISTTREIAGKNQAIHLDDLVVSQTVPKDTFGNP